jgi:hypothetical protein
MHVTFCLNPIFQTRWESCGGWRVSTFCCCISQMREIHLTLHGRCAPKGALDAPGIDGTDKVEQPSKKGKPLPPGKATVGKL